MSEWPHATTWLMVLTSEFFESLGRLTFEFAGLEQMVGLCILQLDPTQKEEEIWRESFERKLGTLKEDVANAAKDLPRRSPNMAQLEELLATATAVGRKRNTIVHGTLHYHAGGELLLKNRAYGGTHAFDATAIDAPTAEVATLYDR